VARADEILSGTRSVLIVDWPSRDVPDTLTEAGYEVTIKGGPGPLPESAPRSFDLIYAHRPFAELAGIVSVAKDHGAKALWLQTDLNEEQSAEARQMVEDAGLAYIDDVYIADAVRWLSAPASPFPRIAKER
jgi:hypothetical protein